MDARRPRRAAARPPRLLAHRRAAHRSDQRVDDRPARRPHRRVVRPTLLDRLGIPAELLPAAASRRATVRGTDRGRRAGRHDRRLARHRLGGRRRARDDRPRSPTSPAARGRSSASSSTRRSSPRPPAPRTSPTRAASTAAPASCATSAGCGCSRSACGRGRRDDLDACSPRPAPLPAGGPTDRRRRPGVHPARAACPTRIAAAAGRPAMTPVETTRCILDSLAAAYARTVARRPSALAGATSTSSTSSAAARRTQLLCQLTADAAGVPVHRRARSRPPRSATCSSRPGPTAPCRPRSKRCARRSPPRRPPEVRTALNRRATATRSPRGSLGRARRRALRSHRCWR